MKKKLVLLTCLCASMFLGNLLLAQTQKVSTKHSDSEVATLIKNYKAAYHRDIYDVDELLSQKFRQDFPDAYSIEWETNGEIYEVEFDVKSLDFEAFYDKDGNLLMYQHEIRAKELPATCRTAVENRYPKHRFDDIERVVQGTQIFYKIEMEYRDEDVKVRISSDGKFIE